MKIVLLTSMEKILYYKFWNHLEKDKFPSKLKEDHKLKKLSILHLSKVPSK
jgi:hypothetical protein